MKAELRSFISPDVPNANLSDWHPPDSDFAVPIQVWIGFDNVAGEEVFQATICTPGWIQQQLDRGEGEEDSPLHLWGHGYIIVPHWDYKQIEGLLQYLCSTSHGDLTEIIDRLARYLLWDEHTRLQGP